MVSFAGRRSKLITLVLLTCGLWYSCAPPDTSLADIEPVGSLLGQDIFISEVLASNRSTNLDPDYSTFSDWIEIHNAGNQEVDLQGFYLTDDLNIPNKWQIPASTVIPPSGCVLFWADERNESRHTNFLLNQSGEEVGLFDPNGLLISAVRFSGQRSDVSLGRRADKRSKWIYYSPPSPNVANDVRGIRAKIGIAPPRFSVPSGFYDEHQELVLTAPFSWPGVTIRYTVDGTRPTSTSAAYSSPIHVDSTTVVRASTFLTGYQQSRVINQTYLIGEDTMLPVVSMIADPRDLWDSETGIYVDQDIQKRARWERPAHIQFYENNKSLGFSTNANIRLFGHTAMEFPQKSLAVFVCGEGETDSVRYALFPPGSPEKIGSFLLRSSSDDWSRTMFRDAMAQQVLQEHFLLDTQRYRPAVLFLNGQYFGIHNIRTKFNEFHLATKYGLDLNDIDLLDIQVDPISGEQAIEALWGRSKHYTALLDFVGSHDMRLPENYAYVQNQIDLTNLIDYEIAEIYVANTSWHRNRKVWRDSTTWKRWRFLVYDLDWGFGDPRVDQLKTMATYDLVFRALLENTEFQKEFIQRFSNHLNTALEPDRVIAKIDDLQAGIEAEMPRHIGRWKDECNNSVCGISSMDKWKAQVEMMREFARQRPAYIWQHMGDKFGVTGTADLDLTIIEPEGGIVLINGLPVSDHFSYTGLVDIPLELTAIPNTGYRFLGWQEIDNSASTVSITLTTDSTLTAMFAPIERPDAAYGNTIPAGLLALFLSFGLFQLARRR